MQTLKQWAVAIVGAIALGVSGTAAVPAADIFVDAGPPPYQPAVPQYGAPVAPVYPYAPPPVVYAYPPPPPVVYYAEEPPPVVVYPRRYGYAYGSYDYSRSYGHYGDYGHRHYGHGGHSYGHRGGHG